MKYPNHPSETEEFGCYWRFYVMLLILSFLLGILLDIIWIIYDYWDLNFLKIIRFPILIMIFIVSFSTLMALQRDWLRKKEGKSKNEEICYSKFKGIFDMYKHADNLFHQRFNFFMVAESMLIVSFATTLSALGEYILLLVAITIVGLFFTFSWAYVNRRLDFRLIFLNNEYLQNYPVYKEYLASVTKSSRYAGLFLVNILPTVLFLFWYFLLIITLKGFL